MSETIEVRLVDEARRQVAMNELQDLSLLEPWRMVLTKKPEKRRTIQNRLMWAWVHQLAEITGNSEKYIHGHTKQMVLMPMQFGWYARENKTEEYDRLTLVQEILERVIPEVRPLVAYDMVYSHKLTVKQFTEYLGEMERYWTDKGHPLISTVADYYDAGVGRCSQ